MMWNAEVTTIVGFIGAEHLYKPDSDEFKQVSTPLEL